MANIHVIAGGYSAGHITPGLALVEGWGGARTDVRFEFMGSADGVEAKLVPEAGVTFVGFYVGAWARQRGLGRVHSLVRLVPAVFAARRRLREVGAIHLTSLGSFAALAPGLAAWSLGLPITIYESNVELGLANRLLLRFSRRLLVSRLYAPKRNVGGPAPEVVGVPLRRAVRELAANAPQPPSGAPRLLVLGGSLGDEFLNVNAPGLAGRLAAVAPGLSVMHQCGLGVDADAVRARYVAAGVEAVVEPYFEEIAPVLGDAHFVVTPAGAITLHEVAAVGVPMLVVPLGAAALAHQHANAAALQAATGCLVCTEEEWEEAALAREIAGVLGDPALWRERSAALRDFSPEDAVELCTEKPRPDAVQARPLKTSLKDSKKLLPTRGKILLSPLQLSWLGVAVLALAVFGSRVVPGWAALVPPDGSLVLPESDPWYHFRQALYCLQNFPHLLRLDPYSHYPLLLPNDAAGLYDVTLAALARVVGWAGGLPPERALGWVCLLLPPLGMAAILPLVFMRLRRHGTLGIGVLMALWVLLLPGAALGKTSLGFCDHHVVEMVAGLLCIHLLTRLVVRERARPTKWWAPAWGSALPLVVFQFTWVGAPLWLPVFALALAGQLASDVVAGGGAKPVLRAAARFWIAFGVLVAVIGLVLPEVVLVPWLWRFTLLGTGALLAALPVAGWFFGTPRLGLKPVGRLLWAGAIALAAGAAAVALSPPVRALLGDLLSAKSTGVSENIRVTPGFYFRVTGLAGVLAVFAPVVSLYTGAWRRAGWWVAMLPSLAFVALWVRTYDYGYQGALHAVLLSGYLFAALTWTGRARWAVPAAATLAVALCVWPLGRTIPLWQPRSAYEGNDIVLATPAWREAMAWLRDATPPPPSPPSGRVGVLTDWGTGNLVNTLSGRPSTSSRFPEAEGVRPLLTEDEDAARAAPLHGSTVAAAVRYVALEPRTIAEYFQPHTTTAGIPPQHYAGTGVFIDTDFKGHRLPTLGAGYDNALAVRLLRRDCAGMGHFRLVYESRAETFLRLVYDPATGALGGVSSAVRSTEERARFAALQGPKVAWREGERWACQGQLLASVKLFEQVEGARLTGRAEPDARVTLTLPLRLRTSGRAFTYERTVRAGGDGAFELVCPYATEAAAGNDVEPAGPAALVWPGGHGRAQISEAAVQTGAVVPVVSAEKSE